MEFRIIFNNMDLREDCVVLPTLKSLDQKDQ